jgi:hypothetical protein
MAFHSPVPKSGNIFAFGNVRPNSTDDFRCFTWPSTGNQNYQVQYTSNLARPNWVNLGASVTGTGGTVSKSDTLVPEAQRFYRVVIVP